MQILAAIRARVGNNWRSGRGVMAVKARPLRHCQFLQPRCQWLNRTMLMLFAGRQGRWRVGKLLSLSMAAALALAVAACGMDFSSEAPPGPDPARSNARKLRDPVYSQSVLGEGGLTLFGNSGANTSSDGATGIGVNSFLWRASLDTLSFMPLSSADPFGGVIITDWHTPPEAPDERFKMTVYILDRALRSDGVRVAVFRQIRGTSGDWIDAPINPRTGGDLEDRILERARQLRIASVGE